MRERPWRRRRSRRGRGWGAAAWAVAGWPAVDEVQAGCRDRLHLDRDTVDVFAHGHAGVVRLADRDRAAFDRFDVCDVSVVARAVLAGSEDGDRTCDRCRSCRDALSLRARVPVAGVAGFSLEPRQGLAL